jgi:hypothetical protein
MVLQHHATKSCYIKEGVMNKKVVFTWLILLSMLVVSSCGGGATATLPPIQTEPPIPEDPTEVPTEVPTEAPTEPPAEANPPESPLIPTEDKPPLSFSPSADASLQPVIGYTLPAGTPDWTVPLKAAAFIEITPGEPGTKTRVGMVEIGGKDPAITGVYEVWIDLTSGDGELVPVTAESLQPVTFLRTDQVVNEARSQPPYSEFTELADPPTSASAISANGVCFVVKTDEEPAYVRYCSKEDSILSVRANFSEQYASVEASIQEVAAELPAELQDAILYDEIISEMEDPQHLNDCRAQMEELAGAEQTEETEQALQENCSSDIAVAPLKAEIPVETASGNLFSQADGRFLFASVLSFLFWQAEPPARTVAVVQVLNPIQTGGTTISAGSYRLDYWYEADGTTFHSATITGVTPEVSQVINQQIPAVPATFVNVDGTEPPGAQISVCRIFGICTFFQKSCS